MASEQRDHEEPIGSDLVRQDASFMDIVQEFVDGLSERMAKMEEAVAHSDFEALRVAAHQLKGGGGGYGYPILTERAAELEECAKATAIGDCTNALQDLKMICERVVADGDAPE